jgi:hypothetical protein
LFNRFFVAMVTVTVRDAAMVGAPEGDVGVLLPHVAQTAAAAAIATTARRRAAAAGIFMIRR